MQFLIGSTKQNNHGAAYICGCPLCDNMATFELEETIEKVYVLGLLPVKTSDIFHLSCTKCQGKFKLINDEIDKIKNLIEKYGANEDFYNSCKAVQVKSLYEEKVFQTVNVCKECGEESSGNMVVCWNCGAEIEEGELEEFTELEFAVDPMLGHTTVNKKEKLNGSNSTNE